VYGIRIEDTTVHVTMTMTSPACPLRDYIQTLVEEAITGQVPDATRVVIEIVSEPPWSEDMMTDEARRQLS